MARISAENEKTKAKHECTSAWLFILSAGLYSTFPAYCVSNIFTLAQYCLLSYVPLLWLPRLNPVQLIILAPGMYRLLPYVAHICLDADFQQIEYASTFYLSLQFDPYF